MRGRNNYQSTQKTNAAKYLLKESLYFLLKIERKKKTFEKNDKHFSNNEMKFFEIINYRYTTIKICPAYKQCVFH